MFASLASEQRPIAERLAAGGIPAVRRAIAAERERARSEGRPEVTGEAILALAEQIAPSVKQAIWLDRAEAAVAQLDQISLRDLRTTVVAAAPRDEASRDLDRKLREELDRRLKKLRANWEEQITHALEEGRVLQALRFSAQPPEPTARFPAALVGRLANTAGAAMTSSTPVERWLAVLDAAVSSPVRRQIHPEGLPEDPSGEVVRKARVAAGSLPALAPLLGLSMPPPPKPLRTARPPRPSRSTTHAPRQKVPPRAAEGAETGIGPDLTQARGDESTADAAEGTVGTPTVAPAEQAPAADASADSAETAPADEAPAEAPEEAQDPLQQAPADLLTPAEPPRASEAVLADAPSDLESSPDVPAELQPEQPLPANADSPS